MYINHMYIFFESEKFSGIYMLSIKFVYFIFCKFQDCTAFNYIFQDIWYFIANKISEYELVVLIYRTIYKCMYTAISIKVVHEQSGKVEYERERLQSCWESLTN
jgi:hypothetical protein